MAQVPPIDHKQRGIFFTVLRWLSYSYYPSLLHRSWKPYFEIAKPKDPGAPISFCILKCLMVVWLIVWGFPLLCFEFCLLLTGLAENGGV